MFASKDTLLTRPSGGYTIARSVRMRSSASAYLNRTLTTPTDNKKWTWSGWVKRGTLSTYQILMEGRTDASNRQGLYFNASDDTLIFYETVAGTGVYSWPTTAVYRDPSAWYHIMFVFDSANATAANRALIYVNGVRIVATGATIPLNQASIINSATPHNIGKFTETGTYFDGYMTEVNFIDGQALTPSSFGETDSITGVWKAKKYGGTYGTNGFYLNFSDNSSNTATTIGKDYSGNGNNWTPNNISVTSGATYDSMTDVPTLTSATAANYAVMNPLDKDSTITASDGNLYVSRAAGGYSAIRGSIMFPTSGKYYAEATVVTTTASGVSASFGFSTDTAVLNNGAVTGQYILYGAGSGASAIYSNGSSLGSLGVAFSAGDVLQVAFDGATGKAWVGRNNVWYNATAGTTGDPANGTNNTFSLSGLNIFPVAVLLNDGLYFNAGQRPFSYTPPTGYVALNTYNLPASTITNGAAYMNASLWTGDAATPKAVVSNLAFSPDFVWIKDRSVGYQHSLQDTVRGTGASKKLYSSLTEAENGANSVYGHINSFDANGFTVATGSGGAQHVNASGVTYIGWQWKAGGTSSSNTNGSITSTVSAGATQGFSVVTYTGTGANATVGHGLGVAPQMIILKSRSAATSWNVYHVSTGNTGAMFLELTNAFAADSTRWNNTSPTSTVFSLGNGGGVNASAGTFVAYCFAPVAGYSAFGSYTGNGSTDGPFIYTGFRPRFFMYKRTDSAGSWVILDSSRNPSNVTTQYLYPNAADAETAATFVDFVSNGVKFRTTYTDTNGSGFSYIYACFAESPFKTSLAR